MSFALTELQNARFTRRENGHQIDQYELRSRAGNVGFTDLFKADTPLLLGRGAMGIPEMVADLSDERTFEYVVMDKGTVNKKVARSCTIDVQQNSSALLQITLNTLVYDFDILPQKLYNKGKGNNEITYSEDFEQKMINIEDDVLASVEASCIASALAYQTLTTAYDPLVPPIYPLVTNAMQVSLAQQFDFLNQIDGIVSLHKFGKGALNVVGSTMYESDVRRYSENGSLQPITGLGVSDAVEAWKLGNKTFRYSDYLPAVAGVNNRTFISKPGAFGLITNNPPAFQQNAITSNGTIFEETGALPLSGFSMGHQRRTDCLDGKETQEFHQFSLNYATITAYNSDAANEPSALFEAHMLNT